MNKLRDDWDNILIIINTAGHLIFGTTKNNEFLENTRSTTMGLFEKLIPAAAAKPYHKDSIN
ncbi:hypothetical protein DERP_015300 [Dermatophagoides pteronyssinus]|uniref:Uncharacterized protein n=1 Tax=Dermatophagoides pteronyssinus TaxID=6956 RepID=A0ABQ8JTM0_DERPT|nr:hypothetical protein DERP_015300 [Dermatophagoides pteronyssinus]